MNKNRRMRIVVGIIMIAVLATAACYLVAHPSIFPSIGLMTVWNSLTRPISASSGTLTATGTVETTQISIAPEAAGKVTAVSVQEGDTVKAGQVLVHLDDSLLEAQRSVALVNLEGAKLALLKLSSPTAIALAQQAAAQDAKDLYNAQVALNNLKQERYNTDLIANALADMVVADNSLSNAQKAYNNTPGNVNTDTSKAMAYTRLYTAQQNYTHATYIYNLYKGAGNPIDVEVDSAAVTLAQAKQQEDQLLLQALTGGQVPADANGVGYDQLVQAQLNVQAAQANLDLIDTQIDFTNIDSPVEGVVLTREVEPGSVVSAGEELLTLGNLDELTITVYVPEDRVGEVALGQTARVAVDSFPGQTFPATVSYISDQAEYTPRNVVTVSGRESTVFAVQLKLGDTGGKLKPGMPADVTFDPN
jgi:HlyD family secretion protein